MKDHIPNWFYSHWRDFAFRTSRGFGVWIDGEKEKSHQTTTDHWVLYVLMKGKTQITTKHGACTVNAGEQLLLAPSRSRYTIKNLKGTSIAARFPLLTINATSDNNPLSLLPSLSVIPFSDSNRLNGIHSRILSVTPLNKRHRKITLS